MPNHDPLPHPARNTIFHDDAFPATLQLTVELVAGHGSDSNTHLSTATVQPPGYTD